MPTPFGAMPDFKRGSRLRDALNADFLQAVKDTLERASSTNVGSWDVHGLTLPEYEPAAPLTYVRIIGATFNSTFGTTEYAYNIVEPQNTIEDGVFFKDASVDSAKIGIPIVSFNPDIPIDGSVIMSIQPGQGGEQFYIDYPQRSEALVQVTAFDSGTGRISYTEISHGGNGTFATRTGGMTGNATVNYAIEPNNQSISIGDRGWVRRGYCPGGARVKIDLIAAGDLESATHCQQNLTIENAAGGNFTLTLDGETTTAIPFNTDATTLTTALNNLSSIPVSSITGTNPFSIEFSGYVEWGALKPDITNLRSKQQWLFSKTASGQNATVAGTLTWAILESYELVESGDVNNLEQFWAAEIIRYYPRNTVTNYNTSFAQPGGPIDVKGEWLGQTESVWLRQCQGVGGQQWPDLWRPFMVRNENYEASCEYRDEGTVTRPVYSYTPNNEFMLGHVTLHGDTGVTTWVESIVDLNGQWEDTDNQGSSTSGDGIANPTNFTFTENMPTFGLIMRRGYGSRQQVFSSITQEANGVDQHQVQTFEIYNGATLWLQIIDSAKFFITTTGSQYGINIQVASAMGVGVIAVTKGEEETEWGTKITITFTWQDYAEHGEFLYLIEDELAAHEHVFVPVIGNNGTTLFNTTLNNATFGGNITFDANITIQPGNNPITVPFNPGDFYGWGKITAANLSVDGWVYSWLYSFPHNINHFFEAATGGDMNNGTLWERNNMSIPVGEHVRVYYGDKTGGNITVTEIQAGDGAEDNEIQDVTVIAGGGSFSLAFNNGTTTATTSPIAFGASNATVQSALIALSNIGAGNVTVAGSGNQSVPYRVTFLLPGWINYANLIGNTTLLTDNQNYICEYEETQVEAVGNGTSYGDFQWVQYADGAGGFLAEEGFEYDAATDRLFVENIRMPSKSGAGNLILYVATATGEATGAAAIPATYVIFTDSNGIPTGHADFKYVQASSRLDIANVRVTSLAGGSGTVYVDAANGDLLKDTTGGNLVYVPAAGANWVDADPTNIKEAIDRLAAAVAGLLGGAIP